MAMLATVVLALLALVVIGAVIILLLANDQDTWAGSFFTAAGALVLFLVIGFFATFTVVSTRNIGVVTTFGRPVGTLSNGPHFVWPWQSVEELDGAIQIDWHKDNDPNGDNHDGAIVVRLANNSNAWADTSVSWEMKQDKADELFLQYKTFDNIRTNLVTRNLQTAMNEVFATYNPLGQIKTEQTPEGPKTTVVPVTESQLPTLATRVRDIMQSKVGDYVSIKEVQIPTIAFDGNTQQRIDELNQQKAATAVAIEKQATASAESQANAEIAASINKDPNVLVNKCLDIVREKGGNVLGCWPGTNVVPTVPASPQG
ncbi:hypothetical protein SEA_CHARGIE21_28 [Mycobacterium phage Chargie21]|nr:hypothetical protein SEA_CHARGIE21_28 [Mycobacterium phage Chargie21]QAY15458.1 hypothetical protein SEA_BASQUIAT_28 [Mycobacterium phage Basquiat]